MRYDDIIIGAGHNGLTAAAYLARAGRSVLVLERDDHVGGAAVSARAFAGVDARLSRYSYLVSLLPRQVLTDLDLDLRLIRRRFSSYTPVPGDPDRGLLVDNARRRRDPRRLPRADRRRRRARRVDRLLRPDGAARRAGLPDGARAAALAGRRARPRR